MFGLLWEFHQTRKINNVQAEARERGYDARKRRTDIQIKTQELERKIDKLELITFSMWSLLKEKFDINEEELLNKIQKIDLMDGEEDGKISKLKVRTCPECNRKSSTHHDKCIYCGFEFPEESAFETL